MRVLYSGGRIADSGTEMTGAGGKTVKILLLVSLLLIVLILWLSGSASDLMGKLDSTRVSILVERAGLWGPVLVVVLMTVAVVASPIPSAPVAIASGAAFGHVAGSIYVIIGAEAGAIIAFAIARYFGRDTVRRWFGDYADMGLLGSQNALTFTVLTSRLMPFISFDMISYAAGLSNLHAWRFALATLAGIIPASFFLAHLGGQAVAGDTAGARWATIALGVFAVLPVIYISIRRARRKDPPLK